MKFRRKWTVKTSKNMTEDDWQEFYNAVVREIGEINTDKAIDESKNNGAIVVGRVKSVFGSKF